MPKNELDDFLAGLENDTPTSDDPFASNAEDPFGNEPEGTPKEEAPKDEETLPFNKDPKVQKYIDRQVNKKLDELGRNTPAAPTAPYKAAEETDSDPLSDVLTRLIGNDTPEKLSAIRDFKKAIGGMKDEAKVEALQEIQRATQEERDAEVRAQKQLADAFDDIEDTFNVDITSNTPIAKKTRNEFLEFVTKVAPKDEYGNVTQYPDLQETFDLFHKTRPKATPPSNVRAKEIAARSVQSSGDAGAAKPATGQSWRDIDKLFSR